MQIVYVYRVIREACSIFLLIFGIFMVTSINIFKSANLYDIVGPVVVVRMHRGWVHRVHSSADDADVYYIIHLVRCYHSKVPGQKCQIDHVSYTVSLKIFNFYRILIFF